MALQTSIRSSNIVRSLGWTRTLPRLSNNSGNVGRASRRNRIETIRQKPPWISRAIWNRFPTIPPTVAKRCEGWQWAIRGIQNRQTIKSFWCSFLWFGRSFSLFHGFRFRCFCLLCRGFLHLRFAVFLLNVKRRARLWCELIVAVYWCLWVIAH